MDSSFFKRIKRLVKNEKKVILLNEAGDDALVIQSLDAYEEENFGWDDSKFDFDDDEEFDYEDEYDENENLDDMFKPQEEKNPEPVAVKPEEKLAEGEDEEDQELLRKVNEDIAKWREEQKQKEQGENLPQKDAPENKKDADLGEEERYYLEPLE